MVKKNADAVLFSGSSHSEFAQAVARSSGIPLGAMKSTKFPDGETAVEILESVRGKQVFVLQSLAINPNEHLMELLIMADALKRASAESIVAVIPYFGYCRQDRKDKPRVPITAKLVANLLSTAGITRLVTMDLHAEQVQGFFDIPVDHLYARPLMVKAIEKAGIKIGIVVAPDLGSVKIARSYAEELKVDFAIVDKHRVSAARVEVLNLIGNVKGKEVLLADDICSTGSTLKSAAKACREKGAKKSYASITHGLFIGDAIKLLADDLIDAVFVADTIALSDNAKKIKNLHSVSVAGLFGQALQCTLSNQSISSLFDNK